MNTNLTTKNHQKDHDQDKKHSNKQYILSFNTYNSNNNELNEMNNSHHHKGTHAGLSLNSSVLDICLSKVSMYFRKCK